MGKFSDLGDMPEDKRIEIIGNSVMNSGCDSSQPPITVAFIVDDHEKAHRYIRKLEDKFPGIRILAIMNGPVKGTVAVRISSPLG